MYTISLCASECFMGFAPSASTPSTAGRHQPALQVQDPGAVVRPSAGDGFLEPRAYAGRCRGDHRLARHRVRGDRSLTLAIALSVVGDSHMTEILALASSSPTVRCHCRHPNLVRTASSIRPDMIF